jgi:predicted aspartyl protease
MTRLVSILVLLVCARVIAADTSENGYPISLTRGSRLMISARVNGHPVEALLDSAAEATLVDHQLATSLQLVNGTAATGHGSGESAFDATLINGVRLQAFGLTLDNQTVGITDLTDVGTRLLGNRIEVILGREIFDAARLRIDIEARQISVMKADQEPGGAKLKLVTEHGIETIPVKVEGQGPVRATFDLGNGSEVLVGSKLAARLHLLTDGRTVTTRAGGGLGGAQQRQVITLHTLEVAGQRFTDVPAAIDTQSTASDVNIGVSVLRQFIITTDFAKRAVWLEPRKTE